MVGDQVYKNVGLQLLLYLPGLLVSRKQRGIWVRWAAAAAGYLVGRLQY